MAQTTHTEDSKAASPPKKSKAGIRKSAKAKAPKRKWSRQQRSNYDATIAKRAAKRAERKHIVSGVRKSVAARIVNGHSKNSAEVTKPPRISRTNGVLAFAPAALVRQIKTDLYDMLHSRQIKEFDKTQLKMLLAAAEDE